MESSSSASTSCSRPRNLRSRLGFFSTFVLALAAIVVVSGFAHKSFSVTVEKETRLLVVDTARFRNPGVNIGVIVPHRTDRGDNMMAPTDQSFNWSHLVGTNAEEAKKKIKEAHPHLQVFVLSKGAMMTMDHNLRRVRIFKDDNQHVASVPKLG